jgi:hypothetical protein
MKNNRFRLCALLLLCIGLTGLKAQSTLYVKEKSGTQTTIVLSDLKKLAIPPGSLVITKTTGSTSTFALSNLRYLSFINYTTDVRSIETDGNSSLSIFPNPVSDQLHISYKTAQACKVQFAIVNVQGSIVQQQSLSSQSGTNHATFAVNHLPVGLYILRLQSGSILETIKFYKN